MVNSVSDDSFSNNICLMSAVIMTDRDQRKNVILNHLLQRIGVSYIKLITDLTHY